MTTMSTPTKPAPGGPQDVLGVMDGTLSKAEGEKPERPKVPEALKASTKAWLEEIRGGADTSDAIRQYKEDLETLFPADRRRRRDTGSTRGANPKKARDLNGQKSRQETREVNVARVFRNSQQTLAMVCPGDISYRWKPRKTIPRPGAMQGEKDVDQTLSQFALTITDRVERNVEEVGFVQTLRNCFRHGIWFRVGVLKITYQRDFFTDELSEERLPDQQEQVARLKFLVECYQSGQFTKTDPEWHELQQLGEAIGDATCIQLWTGISAEVIPLDRFRCDGRIRQLENINAARWQGDWVVMSGEDILERWPYELLPEPDDSGRYWKGVHPDDLSEATPSDENGKSVLEEEKDLRGRQNQGGNATARIKPGSTETNGEEKGKKLYMVFECHARREGRIQWFIEGMEYPLDEQVKTKGPARFFPYHVLNLNPQPNTIYGRSDTELQGPMQDRINRKMSDEEVARWLSVGLRGIIDSANATGIETLNLGKIKPGTFKLMNLGGKGLKDILQILEMKYDPNAFDKSADETDLQRMARFSQQTLGVTGDAEFSSEVTAADAGAQQAAADKAYDGKLFLQDALNTVAELLIQNETSDMVSKESGIYAVWPTIHSDKQASMIYKQIEDEVAEDLLMEHSAAQTEAMMSGMPEPEIDEQQLDMQIEERTRQLCQERFGYPHPMSREQLFKRTQVTVTADLNGQLDRERRVLVLTKFLDSITAMGAKVNLEPLARLMAKLMGEDDELGAMLQPDPTQLAATLDQVMRSDPASMTPEGATMIAQLGQLAQQYLVQAQQQQNAQQATIDTNAPKPEIPAPADAP